MRLGLFIAAFVFSTGSTAWLRAQQLQPWLADRRYGEGIGYRTGDLELHPGLAAEFGYDSNYLQRSGTAREPEIHTLILRPTASFSVSTLGPQRRAFDTQGAEPPTVNWNARIALSYHEFLWASREEERMRDLRNLSARAGARLDILPERPWGGDLLGDFQRTIQPSNSPESEVSWNRDTLRLGAGVVWRPGGGTFEWRLGYEFLYHYFESPDSRPLTNAQHYAKTRGRWRFLPRTALLYDAELGFISYGADQRVLNDSTPVRSRIGINGLVTHHFGLLALIGWGASFYQPTHTPVQDFDSVIGQAELTWYLLPQPRLPSDAATVGLSSIAAGYVRDFTNSYLSAYYQRDRGYLKLSYLVAGSLLLLAEGGLSHLSHPPSYYASGNLRYRGYGENRVDGLFFAEYRFSDSWGINTTFRYDANLTETRMPVVDTAAAPGGAAQAYDELEFSRYQAFLGARWFM